MRRFLVVVVCVEVIFSFLFPSFTYAAELHDMSSSSEYSFRIDGSTNEQFSGNSIAVDMNGNGKKDLVVTSTTADYNGTDSGSVYVIYDSLLDKFGSTGKNIDLSDSHNYNFRFDGPGGTAAIIGFGITGDLDRDGKPDIIIGNATADNNSRNNSGSVYVIYNSLFSSYGSTTGNSFNLGNASSYSLRFDGAIAGDQIGQSSMAVADIDNDGNMDLLLAAPSTDFNSRTDSGSIYVIYNSSLTTYTGTGNNIDLATSSKYNLRFDGAVANDTFGQSNALYTADLDRDGKTDIIAGSIVSDFNSRTDSGSLYVIYNSSLTGYTGTGNNIDLATSTNYNLRFDAATAGDNLARFGIAVGDVNNDGQVDLAVSSRNTDFNSRTDSGSLYVIYSTLLNSYTGTGNNIDLATSSKYNLRFDGATAGDFSHPPFIGDYDNNGQNDLLIGARNGSDLGRTSAGTLYVVLGPNIVSRYGTTTGNNIDLANSNNYDVRYDGAAAGDILSHPGTQLMDINNDGILDLIIPANATDARGTTDTGSLYVIYMNNPQKILFSLDYPGGNSHITNTHPTFRWKKATVLENSVITKYELWVDNGNSNNFHIDNISPGLQTNTAQNNLNYILYDDGTYLNLTTKDSFGALTLGKKNWRIIARDSWNHFREESVDFYVDQPKKIPTPFPNYRPLLTANYVILASPNSTPTVSPIITSSPYIIPTEPLAPIIETPTGTNMAKYYLIFGGVILGVILFFVLWKRKRSRKN